MNSKFNSEKYEASIVEEAEEIVKETFPKIWNGYKNDMKDYSKKELAEKMYLFGILTYIRIMDLETEEIKKEFEKDPKIKELIEEIKEKDL